MFLHGSGADRFIPLGLDSASAGGQDPRASKVQTPVAVCVCVCRVVPKCVFLRAAKHSPTVLFGAAAAGRGPR